MSERERGRESERERELWLPWTFMAPLFLDSTHITRPFLALQGRLALKIGVTEGFRPHGRRYMENPAYRVQVA